MQYADRKFSDSAKNFAAAAKRLQGDPLQGRALIGQAVSLIKDNNADAGVAQLLEISSKTKLLPTDRFEANFLLGVQAIGEKDEDGFSKYRDNLAKDEKAASFPQPTGGIVQNQ